MGIYLNPDNNNFSELRYSDVCVDKSLLIKFINSRINVSNKYLCVARPRRFGKSTDAYMLVAYYSKGCNSSQLFDNLKISQCDNYHQHLNSHNVVFINMLKFYKQSSSIEDMIDYMNDDIIDELKEEYEFKINRYTLTAAFSKIYAQTKNKFIFIIDEWDCVLRNKDIVEKEKVKYIDYLDVLFKDQPYVELVYMTGILPIKKSDDQSTFNMFDEITMISSTPLEEYMGFTVNDVKALCTQYQMDYDEVKSWYDGYHLDNHVSIYSPRSIIQAITKKTCKSYWVDTSNFEDLKLYINMNFNGLKDDIIRLLTGERITINPRTFRNDVSLLNSKDDVLTLLVHFGYLGYDQDYDEVYIPNKEVVDSFTRAISQLSWKEAEIIKNSQELLKATWNRNEEKVAKYIEQAHQQVSIIQYNDENALAYTVNYAYIAANNYYTMLRETPTGKGYADIIFIPFNPIHPAMIIELKWKKDTDIAINQILEKEYYASLKHYLDNLLIIGITYDKDPHSKDYKKHYCQIRKYKE